MRWVTKLGARPPRAAPGGTDSGVDAAVFQEPGANRAHRALVRGGELLQRAAGIERGQELAVLFLGPRLAGFLRHLLLAPLEALDALERARRLVQRSHDLRPLIRAVGREHFAAFRIDSVGERPHYRQGLCCVHCVSPPSTGNACAGVNASGWGRVDGALRKGHSDKSRLRALSRTSLCRFASSAAYRA